MNRPSEIVVLAEDAMHQSFIRQYLYRLGYTIHQIRFEIGGGEQWVLRQYAKEVGEFRWRSAKAATSLVIVIDADVVGVIFRHQQLGNALKETDLFPRSHDERIIHLIPNRNIETWILCLNGEKVDESSNFKKWADLGPRVKPAAEMFYAWTRRNTSVPDHCIPSLRQAIPEAQRLEP